MSINFSKVKAAVSSLSTWDTSGKAFGFFSSQRKASDDYLYEFYCAMRILNDLNKHQSITIEPNSKGLYVFPRKPGIKREWSYFALKSRSSKDEFQFCLGTEIAITDSLGTSFGADISLQYGNSPDYPNEKNVIWIMDGKYKKSNSSSLDIGTIREFAQCVSDMKTPKKKASKLKFDTLGDLNSNCLLTNANVIKVHKNYCVKRKLKQIGLFNISSSAIDVVG